MTEIRSNALLVGVKGYTGAELQPLPSAGYDVEALAVSLASHRDGTDNFEVTQRVVDSNEPWGAHDLLQDVSLKISDCDHFLFYFSGHGLLNPFGLQLATPEKEHSNDSGVYFDVLLRRFNESEAKEVTVILDCCFSGAAGDSPLGSSSSLDRAKKALTLTHLREGVTILASSDRTQESEGFADGPSAFTRELLNGLDDDAYSAVDVIDLYKYTRRRLDSQSPVLRTFGSQFSPIRARSLAAMREASL